MYPELEILSVQKPPIKSNPEWLIPAKYLNGGSHVTSYLSSDWLLLQENNIDNSVIIFTLKQQ